MELRPLGRTGLRVSPLGFGAVKIGRNTHLKYPEPFELPSDERVLELLAIARRHGVNLLDTAAAYGTSEERLGALLTDRDEWVIVTKAGEELDERGSRYDFSPEAITKSVHRSLARLRTDRLDVVLLHSNGDDLQILRESGAVEALVALREVGKVGAIGASTKTVEGGLLAVERCDVVMVALSREDRSQLPVVEAARKAGVGVLVKKALASGHDADPVKALLEVVRVPGVSSVVVGTASPTHWAENCEAVERALAPA